MSTHPLVPLGAVTMTHTAPLDPVIVEHYGRLQVRRTGYETELQWRGDVAYAKAVPLVPWLLALPACLAIAIVQAMAVARPSWSWLGFARDVLVYAVAVCLPGWLLAVLAVRVGAWLYARLVRTSLVLTARHITGHRRTPFGTTVLLPPGSRAAAVHHHEHVERLELGRHRYTLARHSFTCLRATGPDRRRHDVDLGYGLDQDGRQALGWMLSELTLTGTPGHRANPSELATLSDAPSPLWLDDHPRRRAPAVARMGSHHPSRSPRP